jgi:dihydropteroate synthase-like protein
VSDRQAEGAGRKPRPGERILFVTGQLAAPSLRPLVAELAARHGFHADVHVAGITVAALMPAAWLIGKLQVPAGVERVILPGWCDVGLDRLRAALDPIRVELGPKDLRELPAWLAGEGPPDDYGDHGIEILAEINHANRLPLAALRRMAVELRGQGADVIDLGATPGEPWAAADRVRDRTSVTEAVESLRDLGLRVSIDSFDPAEVRAATSAGAELVLSVRADNVELAADLGTEVVAIPSRADAPEWLEDLGRTSARLSELGVRHRLDPVLEPIGFGFTRSLLRYAECRKAFPDAAMMMGVGNLTELTAVDSAGVNALLIAICEELGIGSVLTTQVIPWGAGCVREIDVARRLMRHAVRRGALPKKVDDRLVMLRSSRRPALTEERLDELAAAIRDPNFRLFAENGRLHAINGAGRRSDEDPFLLFERLGVTEPSHAFYLGWELAKARIALTLGKPYVQDQALDFGMLTVPERSHRSRRQSDRRD